MRLRILFGTLALVPALALYAWGAMALAARMPDSAALVFAFYAVAGVAWIAPAGLLTRWMARAAPYRPPPEA